MPRVGAQPKPPTPQQLAAREAGGERLREAARRRTQIAQVRKMVETSEQKIGQDQFTDLPSEGPARVDPPAVQAVENPISQTKLEVLAFMEEYVTIIIHDTNDTKADPFPAVWNDGISQYFIRNKDMKVRRKFVEVLARMKGKTYSQEKVVDPSGNETYRMIPHTALVYPFAVVEDANPKGAAWLKSVLGSA